MAPRDIFTFTVIACCVYFDPGLTTLKQKLLYLNELNLNFPGQ